MHLFLLYIYFQHILQSDNHLCQVMWLISHYHLKIGMESQGEGMSVWQSDNCTSCLSSCLSSWLFVTFLPEKQRLSLAKKTLTHQVFVVKINHHDCQSSQTETSGNTWETLTLSSWRVPSRLFRSRSASFLCELHSGTAETPRSV